MVHKKLCEESIRGRLAGLSVVFFQPSLIELPVCQALYEARRTGR